jgi:hypothetical protein
MTGMPRYAAMIYAAEPGVPPAGVYQAQRAFAEAARKAGVLMASDLVAPASAATTVLVRDGRTSSAHGPAAGPGRELAGVCVLECRDLDEAIGWAARIPAAVGGAIELRPVLESERARGAWAVVERMVEDTRRQRAEYEARRTIADRPTA